MKALKRIKRALDAFNQKYPEGNFSSSAFRDFLAETIYDAVMTQGDGESSTYNTNQLELFSFKEDVENK